MKEPLIKRDEKDFIESLKRIVSSARGIAYASINYAQVQSNWLLGQRIVEQMQKGKERAEYGSYIIKLASEALTEEFGKGYSESNIRSFRMFYLSFSDFQIQQTLSAESEIRMYDELKRTEGDNPTIGILLCSQTDKDIARYSILKGSEQIFTSKYQLLLPSEEELANEIRRQKEIFLFQNKNKD